MTTVQLVCSTLSFAQVIWDLAGSAGKDGIARARYGCSHPVLISEVSVTRRRAEPADAGAFTSAEALGLLLGLPVGASIPMTPSQPGT